MSNKISREELVKIYEIDITFFDELEEFGLLKTETEDDVKYLLYEELPTFEKFANWHYDLEVNMPGLQVIQNLLSQIHALQQENRQLMNKMFVTTENWEDDVMH